MGGRLHLVQHPPSPTLDLRHGWCLAECHETSFFHTLCNDILSCLSSCLTLSLQSSFCCEAATATDVFRHPFRYIYFVESRVSSHSFRWLCLVFSCESFICFLAQMLSRVSFILVLCVWERDTKLAVGSQRVQFLSIHVCVVSGIVSLEAVLSVFVSSSRFRGSNTTTFP